jgi:hypothetical protein
METSEHVFRQLGSLCSQAHAGATRQHPSKAVTVLHARPSSHHEILHLENNVHDQDPLSARLESIVNNIVVNAPNLERVVVEHDCKDHPTWFVEDRIQQRTLLFFCAKLTLAHPKLRTANVRIDDSKEEPIYRSSSPEWYSFVPGPIVKHHWQRTIIRLTTNKQR